MKRLTSVWDLWLIVLCTCLLVIGLEFDPGHKSVFSHSVFLFWPVLVEHLTLYPYIIETLQHYSDCYSLQIGSNGIISFGSPYNPFLNEELPVPDVALVAPYWDDVDTRFGSGQISYEIHQSGYFLEEVSEFIRRRRSALAFTGTWMMIVYWDAVHPFFGFFVPQVCHLFFCYYLHT